MALDVLCRAEPRDTHRLLRENVYGFGIPAENGRPVAKP